MRRLYAPRGPLSRVPRSGPVARVLAEHQRLDRDRHGLRGHADAPEIDVIEVPQDYAVDDEDLALDADLVAQDRAQGLSDVAVDHNVYRRALREGVLQPARYPGRERGDALVRRRALPAQRERGLGLALDQVESREVGADGASERVGVDALAAGVVRLQHLQVAPRQKRARVGDVDGVAGELHAVLGRAERGGADALARRQQRPGQGTRVELVAQRQPEQPAHIAEVAGLAAVDILTHTAREHHAVDAAQIGKRLGEEQRADGLGHG